MSDGSGLSQHDEAALRASEQRFRAFVTASEDVVYRMSADWSQMRELDGRGFLADTRKPSEEWMENYIEPHDRPLVQAAIDAAIQTRSIFELEHRVRRADGSLGWIRSRAVPILDEDDEIIEWLGAATDITDKVRAAAAIREGESLRRVALAGGRMGSWRWNLDQRLIWGDVQFLALWGLPPTDAALPLSIFTDRMSPEGGAEMEVIVAKAVDVGEEFDGSLEIVSGPTAGRWIRWRGRAADDDASVLHGITFDITEQKRGELRLLESEERQAFLLGLTDALRPLVEQGEIERTATRLLGEYLRADRCFLSPVYEDGSGMCVREEYLRGGASSVLGDYTFAQFGEFVGPELHAGRILAVEDVDALEGLDPAERASYAATEIGAYLLIPLVRDGRLAAFLTINHRTPRAWSDADKAVARQTADRLWTAREHARAETALRDSERFTRALVEGVPQLVWRAVDGGEWTWASPQWRAYTGQAEADSHGRGWLSPVHPDDRERVLAIWHQAIERGEFHADYRICHSEERRYRWFQTRATPVRDDEGRIVEWLGTSTDVDDLRELQEQQKVLVAELQHRTRNLIGVVRSMADKTARASDDMTDFRQRFRTRLDALARVQGLLSRLNDYDRVTFDELIETELSALGGDTGRVTLRGPSGVRLRSSTVQTLALGLHELGTNAVKYGALGQAKGHLAVFWFLEESDRQGRPWLHIDWRETGVTMPAASAPARRSGQGRELIERALPYQLGAKTTYELGSDGIHCTIAMPVSAITVEELDHV